jgi:tRNA-dihydrouridine synthase B
MNDFIEKITTPINPFHTKSAGNSEPGLLPLFLAPMEDVTYSSFRYMCKKYGADVMYTEFVSSEALIRHVPKTREKMKLFDFDHPAGIQLFGHDIGTMVTAAKIVEEAGPDFIDLNFGCPMKKIVNKGAGAALLKDLPKMQEMAKQVVRAVHLPVTAKIRLGWDQQNQPIVEAAERLQDAGIVALAIHGRTRDQLYTGRADWTLIGKVKRNPRMKIPVIGNGDITGAQKAKQLVEQTGVDGLMIGRPAIGRPWIFKEIKNYLAKGEIPPSVTVDQAVEKAREQLQITCQWKEQEKKAILMMRRHLAKYFPGLPNFREIKTTLLRADTYNEVNHILDQIREKYTGQPIDYDKASLH